MGDGELVQVVVSLGATSASTNSLIRWGGGVLGEVPQSWISTGERPVARGTGRRIPHFAACQMLSDFHRTTASATCTPWASSTWFIARVSV